MKWESMKTTLNNFATIFTNQMILPVPLTAGHVGLNQ